MVNVLRPNANQETKELLVRTLLSDLLHLGNGRGLELVLPEINEKDTSTV